MGREVGARLRGGEIISLIGPLGTGKTCFTQGIAIALGIPDASSPSYVLITQSEGRLRLYHVDAYRLDPIGVVIQETGIEDCSDDSSICVIEWADRIMEWIPSEQLEIRFAHEKNGRRMEFHPHGKRYRSLVKELDSLVSPRN